MEFRILGGLEVEHEGRLLPLRGRLRRSLLVRLLLSANEVVPDERLLDDLWAGEPPRSGRAALRVRVSQLRKALDGDAVLVTRSPGYVLQIGPDDLDALRFERLVAEGRKALAGGRSESAAAMLGDALALWRGPALADVTYEPWAAAEIAQLEELRRVALAERIEADLALGRHAELVGELEALVTAEPLRERLRAQLIFALYRSGRQADALAAYRAARETLVEELGIEPGRALQELEAAILRQDPGLDLPRPPVRAAEPRAPITPSGEERKIVTVLVAELGGSAILAEASDPERTGALLERLARALRETIEEAGGRVESLAGASLTAVFGAPVAQEDHAERTLQTALILRRRLTERFGSGLVLRIGVDTGEVVVGHPREGATMLTGGAVLSAGRLANAAKPGATLVGERTVAAARGGFEFGPPADVGEAGTARPLGRALALTRTARPGGRSVFVGRDGDLELLRAEYRRAAEQRRPRLVTVVGDAGVGKTRLVRELWDSLAAESPEPLRRTGRCLPTGRGTTYRPLAEILREQYGLAGTDGPAEVRRALGDREILALTLGIAVAEGLHPLTARERLHAAWVDLLVALAREQPVVVLVEDLHWAQEPLLDLLERVLDEVDGPLVLVGTARPELIEVRPSWGRRREAATVWLEPLSREEAGRMLAGLGGVSVSDEVRRALLERAEGNPFFLEELLAGLHDRALPTGSDVPDSVQAVLAARIDLLPPVEKAALQAASVIGRVFWRGPVRELLGGDSPDFAVLEARDFVRRRSGPSLAGEREFAFKHALTRDVAYASVPKARRARLHAAFAAWIERVGGGRDEHAPYLADHYAEAVRPEDADLVWEKDVAERERLRGLAVTWLRRAGDLATTRYELDDAIALYERALELAASDEERAQLSRALGRANALKFDGEAFWTAMQNAIAVTTDREMLAELYARLSFETGIRAGMWRRRPDSDLVDGWIERALELAEPGSRAEAEALLALCHWNPEGAGDAAARASAIAERLRDPELRSYAWDARGVTDFVAGEYDLGRAWEERRFELLEEISDPEHKADIYYAPITGCVLLGHFSEARRLALRHDEISQPLTPHHRMHGIAVLLELEELLGAWPAAAALQPEAETRVAANAATPCVRNARALLVCSVANEEAGDAAEARRLEESAEALGMEGFGHVLDTPRIRLGLARGDLESVERLLAEPMPERGWHRGWLLLSTYAARLDALAALGHRAELEAWPRVRPNTYLEPFYLRALGVVLDDDDRLRRARARFESLGLSWHAAQTAAPSGDV
jgi:DNA-binding SARP family transcriptional activator